MPAGHLAARPPAVAHAAHPGDHRDRHDRGHREQGDGGRIGPELGAAVAKGPERGLAGDAEDDHAREHGETIST